MSAPQRYDHPTFTKRSVMRLFRSTAGTTQVSLGRIPVAMRIKSLRSLPAIIGTSDTGVHVLRHITGTTTAVLGTITTGTIALTAGISPAAVALGAGNSPPGLACSGGDQITATNAVDGTVVYDLYAEYEITPDATLLA